MPDQSIAGVLRAQARRHPDRPFLTCGTDRLTFGELDERTDRVAAGLSALGVRPGDRVALLIPNRVEMAELFFALAKLGAIQVPLNAFLKGEFLRYQLADCTATVLVADSAGIAAALPLLEGLSGLTGIVCLDEPDAEVPDLLVTRYADLRQTTSPLPEVEVTATQLMSIVYTSGTTGFPKGCMLPHGYYLRCGQVMVDTVELTDDDVLLTAMPLFHGACRMLVLAAGLLRGIEVCIEPEFRASTFLHRAAEVGATFALGVGAMGTALLAQPPGAVDRAHRLRAFMLIPFPPDRQDQFRERFGVDA
jgi:crotonobetaine/carnitine-CoA ligase